MNTTSTAKAKLLIVDDEIPQLRAMCDTLEAEGYSVTGSSSAKQALEAMRDERFDLAITDLTMPDLDGIAFLTTAREMDPLMMGIVMTGHGTIDTAVAAMKAGAFDYILKPFTLRMIRPVLDRALNVRRLMSENVQLRQTEEMIRSINASLEKCVEDRTRQLTDANKELEAFAHSISHDLRGPLRAVNNFTHLLVEECQDQLNERAQGYVERVLGSVGRMEQLIEDLMRLSRVNGADLRRIDIDVSKMVASIVAEFQVRDPGRRVDMSISEGLHAEADPQLLRIALENLLGNAWKFTKNAEGARIEFGVADVDTGLFYVRDNGAGFDAEYAKDLFVPFRRLHTSAEFPGTGIGLSIVQRIIRRHGGCVAAEGSPGQGATFYFSIPGSEESVVPEHWG
jgi:two-component system, sensor histidine kinase and response regulator